jgi:predicted DNA-binding protein (UPF0251 family)
MPRPHCCRRISGRPVASVFKPMDSPACETAEVVITLDEFEAIRLSDFDGLYQEQAAERMNVSRATFGRVLESAHRKVAQVLVSGLVLRIEGGPVCTGDWLQSCCRFCAAQWESAPVGPVSCLACRGNGVQSGGVQCNRSDLPPECLGKRCWRLGNK